MHMTFEILEIEEMLPQQLGSNLRHSRRQSVVALAMFADSCFGQNPGFTETIRGIESCG